MTNPAPSPSYAHSVDERPEAEWETLEEHSRRVAQAAGRWAEPFGGAELARLAGLLHDLGKAKQGFQARLRDPTIREPHAAEGARAACEAFGLLGRLLAFGIAGHHGALPNAIGRGSLAERVQAAAALDLPSWVEDGPVRLPGGLQDPELSGVTANWSGGDMRIWPPC